MHYPAETDATVGTTKQRPAGAVLEMLALLAVWAAAVVLVNPRGNFPLHDDWHHAWPTLQFANTGHFQLTRYTAPSLRAQVLWGALWIRMFGFSFEVLRASTLTLSAASVLLINRLLAAEALPAIARRIGSLAFAFHPLFFLLSFTFMTEVPFVFLSIVAYACFAAGLERDRTSFFVAGTLAAVASCFIRQTGAITIGATALLLLIFRERIARRWLAHSAALAGGVLILGSVALVRIDWLRGSPAEFRTHYRMWSESNFGLFEQIAMAYHYLWFQAADCALFLLPLTAPLLLLLLIRRPISRRSAIALCAIAILLLARSLSLVLSGDAMPFTNTRYHSDLNAGQTFDDFGLGLLSMAPFDGTTLRGPIHLLPFAKTAITFGVAIIGAVALWALIEWLLRAAAAPASNRRPLLAASLVLCGSAALVLSGYYFDRYSLDSAWALVLVLPVIVPWQRRATIGLSVAALVVVAIFAIAATHDYFAWNRARWELYTSLRSRGIPASQIHGGLEVIGWEELVRNPTGRKWPNFGGRPYVIAFRPLAGTRVVAKTPYRRWIGLWNDELYAVVK